MTALATSKNNRIANVYSGVSISQDIKNGLITLISQQEQRSLVSVQNENTSINCANGPDVFHGQSKES